MRIGPMEKIVAIRNLFAARIRDADDRLEPPGDGVGYVWKLHSAPYVDDDRIPFARVE